MLHNGIFHVFPRAYSFDEALNEISADVDRILREIAIKVCLNMAVMIRKTVME